MLTRDALLSAGYTFYQPRPQLHDRSDGCYAKRIKRDATTLYSICIKYYDHRKYGDDREGWQPEVQFNSHGWQHPTFNVTLIPHGMDIDAIEEFFAKLYWSMDCKPYEEDT